MRLTIRDKKPLLTNLGNNTNRKEEGFLQKTAKGCCGGDLSKKHKLLIARNTEERNMQNLIRFDCQNLYSRVCCRGDQLGETQKNLYECIVDAIQSTHSRYNQCIGYLCAHAVYHYSSEEEREHAVYAFLHSYRPIFDRPELQEALVQETLRRFYMYLKESDIDIDALPLERIVRKYQQSLLLEFIPVEYSEFIISEYLRVSDPEEYIELATSVVHFIVNTKSPLNTSHCAQMMLNPFMGVVEWPIVIGHRKLFQPFSEDDQQG